MAARVPFRRYVALGDSFTEGLCDPAPPPTDHPWRGWADRLAEELSARAVQAGEPPLEYANLAVRGRLLTQILDQQVEPALDLRPDLVSLVGGGNDVLRRSVDVDDLVDRLDAAVARLRAAGCTVLLSTAYDPQHMPLVRRVRGRSAIFTANVWSLAQRHGAHVLDLWGMRSLYHPRLWAPDRIHLTAEGHRMVALHALDVLGVDRSQDWRTPLPAVAARTRLAGLREDALWFREHAVPWLGRRLRGRSSGDGLAAKRPLPGPLLLAAATRPEPAGRGPEDSQRGEHGQVSQRGQVSQQSQHGEHSQHGRDVGHAG